MNEAARTATAVNIAGLVVAFAAGARRHRADDPGLRHRDHEHALRADIRGRRRGQPGVRGPAAHHAGEHRRRRDRHRRRGPRDPDEPDGAGADRLDGRRRARPADRGSLRHRQRGDSPAGGESGDEGPARGHDRHWSRQPHDPPGPRRPGDSHRRQRGADQGGGRARAGRGRGLPRRDRPARAGASAGRAYCRSSRRPGRRPRPPTGPRTSSWPRSPTSCARR